MSLPGCADSSRGYLYDYKVARAIYRYEPVMRVRSDDSLNIGNYFVNSMSAMSHDEQLLGLSI